MGTIIQLHKTVSLNSLHDYYMHTTKGTSTLWERCIEGYCTQMYHTGGAEINIISTIGMLILTYSNRITLQST